ncbi:MAG TPA: UPF0149 family protein [Casimicrobiaceae bacterium]
MAATDSRSAHIPLGAAELDRLAAALASERMADAMPLDAAQGALYALASGPGEFPDSADVMALLIGTSPAGESGESRDAVVALLVRFAEQCRREMLEAEDELSLILFDGEDGRPDYTTWCRGYLEGVDASPVAWTADEGDAAAAELLLPIEVLAAGDDADPALVDGIADVAAYRREAARDLVGILVDIRHHFFDLRTSRVPAKRDAPKVGRNERCPCGSGRKFKQCHGRAA